MTSSRLIGFAEEEFIWLRFVKTTHQQVAGKLVFMHVCEKAGMEEPKE